METRKGRRKDRVFPTRLGLKSQLHKIRVSVKYILRNLWVISGLIYILQINKNWLHRNSDGVGMPYCTPSIKICYRRFLDDLWWRLCNNSLIWFDFSKNLGASKNWPRRKKSSQLKHVAICSTILLDPLWTDPENSPLYNILNF